MRLMNVDACELTTMSAGKGLTEMRIPEYHSSRDNVYGLEASVIVELDRSLVE
jgi:hypothetical protein